MPTPRKPSTKRPSKPRPPAASQSPDWQSTTLARVRALIIRACPDAAEERKWKKLSNNMLGVPVWSSAGGGIICTGETYKHAVKLTFAKGAALPDPACLFNASLEGTTRRAIDIHEGDTLNERAFQTLIRAANALNDATRHAPARRSRPAKPRLLSGDNPQVRKAHGDAPVQAYIAAIPGWKRDTARRLDTLITATVPNVRKAVKWNSPFYAAGDERSDGSNHKPAWFLTLHCFTHYIKVAFLRGTSLRPVPPVKSKQKEVRYLHIHEHDTLDEQQLTDWITQAARLPGIRM